ncbi:intraflagellar transport protein 27 homolog [Ruditapes philippinarum]|uniref:intraflagellar transport protein 27 homolog n=1 Tax=Ruditapes philippinarum TaxID=129788 RepID=UPI00295BDB49|nr:intraflagellar transport protein 27 homolog [Ruditapes philippinarum]
MPTVLRAKCVVVGDSTSGKSSLCQVFHSDSSFFPKNYTMTTGVDMLVKQVNIPDTKDGVELYMYDSAGKELFAELVPKFWEHTSMVIVVYDATSETSFNSCEKWLRRVRQENPDVQMPGVLIANKIDLDQRRVISPKMGADFAASQGLKYFECSAKEMQGVDAPFYYLANEFYVLYREKMDLFKSLGMQ